MQKYQFSFEGKFVGSIRVSYGHNVTVEAENLEKAIQKLYDTHEHISKLKVFHGGEYVPCPLL